MGFGHPTGYEMCYYIMTEDKNQKYLIVSVIRNRRRQIVTDEEYINEDPKQAPDLNDMELGFVNSLNDIIYGEMDKIPTDKDKV